MHEASLMSHLLRQVLDLAAQHQARKVTEVRVQVGAWSHLSQEHLQEHFRQAARGTLAADACIVAAGASQETFSTHELWLESIAVET